MKQKVAVVVPVYNDADSVRQTVDCLLNQTLRELQIIVVDDGSTDGTADVLNEMRARDPRIEVYRQKNGGGYAARAYGLRFVDAEYVGFVDADDLVDPIMYEQMYALAKSENVDIVQCDIEHLTDGSSGVEIFRTHEDVVRNIVRPVLGIGTTIMSVCDKIYRVPNDGVRLEPSNIMTFDDYAMNLQFLLNVNSFAYLHQGFYHYRITNNSSVRRFDRRHVEDFVEARRFRKKYLPRYGISDEGAQSAWFRTNLRNMFILASSAASKTLGDRLDNVRALYEFNRVPVPRFLLIKVVIVFFAKKAQRAFKASVRTKMEG